MLSGLLVDDTKHVLDRLPRPLRPSSQLVPQPRGDEGNPAFGIGRDHGIADAGERDPQPLALLAKLAVGLMPVQRQLDLGGQFPFLERLEDIAEGPSDFARARVPGSLWAVR